MTLPAVNSAALSGRFSPASAPGHPSTRSPPWPHRRGPPDPPISRAPAVAPEAASSAAASQSTNPGSLPPPSSSVSAWSARRLRPTGLIPCHQSRPSLLPSSHSSPLVCSFPGCDYYLPPATGAPSPPPVATCPLRRNPFVKLNHVHSIRPTIHPFIFFFPQLSHPHLHFIFISPPSARAPARRKFILHVSHSFTQPDTHTLGRPVERACGKSNSRLCETRDEREKERRHTNRPMMRREINKGFTGATLSATVQSPTSTSEPLSDASCLLFIASKPPIP